MTQTDPDAFSVSECAGIRFFCAFLLSGAFAVLPGALRYSTKRAFGNWSMLLIVMTSMPFGRLNPFGR